MSIKLRNFTPMKNLRFVNTTPHPEAKRFGIYMAKATYRIEEDGWLELADEQEPLSFTDTCHGEVNETSLRLPSDLVAYKPCTDIHLTANACAPNGEPTGSWFAGLKVEGGKHPLEKVVRVTGPRQWQPVWKRELEDDEKAEWKKYRKDFSHWELSMPEPTNKVPLRYEHAFGGLLTEERDEGPFNIAFERNPLGIGWINKDLTDHTSPQPAPQIEAHDAPISDPYEQVNPECFAPIMSAWLPRRPLGGTYDQNWLDNIWPNWPPDYQYSYHNSAHPDLIYPEFLRGDETIVLAGMRSDPSPWRLQLPGHLAFCQVQTEGSSERVRQDMKLDTLHIDVSSDNPADHKVMMVWRLTFDADLTQLLHLRFDKLRELTLLERLRGMTLPAPSTLEEAS